MKLVPRIRFWLDVETRRAVRHNVGATVGTIGVALSVGCIFAFATNHNVLAAVAAFIFFMLGFGMKSFIEGHCRFWQW